MTNQTDINEKIKKVNAILRKGEPDNVSKDSYSGYSGYKPQYIIDALNEVIGIGKWGFIEKENKLADKDENGKPKMAIAKVAVWIENPEHQLEAYGQGKVTRGDYGDARKSAQTDAIKKALSYFSVGNRAFHGLLEGN